MHKSKPGNSRNTGSGSKSNFRKDDNGRPSAGGSRPSFKKNYDGRSTGGDDRPGRKPKPYSGRVSDGERTPGSDRGGKGMGSGKPRRNFDNGEDTRIPGEKRSFDRPKQDTRPFRDRNKFDSDKGPAERRSFGKDGGDRKPFDRDGAERRPFEKKSFDKKPYGKKSFDKDDTDRKPFDRDRADRKPFEKKSFDKKPHGKKSFDKDGTDRKPFDRDGGERRPFEKKSFDKKPYGKKSFDKDGADRKPFDKREKNDAEDGEEKRTFGSVMNKAFSGGKKKNEDDDIIAKPEQFEDKVYGALEDVSEDDKPKPKYGKKRASAPAPVAAPRKTESKNGRKKKYRDDDQDEDEDDREINQTNGPRLEMPLNKYIAHSGECSRRDAAELVKQGKVKVNDELVLDPGYRVKHDDRVTMSGKKLTPQTGLVYILLNKPKGFITTNEDPQGRKTVMDLVDNSGVDRLFPVGRLDRDTSGLLLITNDGDLTQKLCHPSYNVKKIYQVTTDKPVTHADFEKILAGVELEDGIAKVDALSYLEKKTELGLEIHSGRNRIVRRIFEALGYEVVKLDRVMYAGLTKKNLPRSKWRYLNDREIILLKHFKN